MMLAIDITQNKKGNVYFKTSYILRTSKDSSKMSYTVKMKCARHTNLFVYTNLQKSVCTLLKMGCNCNTARSVPTIGRNLRF